MNTIFGGFGVTGKPWVLTYLPGATLQNDVIAYFQLQILRSYWNRVSPLLQIPMERLWKLTGKPSKPKDQNWKQHFWKILWGCGSLGGGNWSCAPSHRNSYFYSYTYKNVFGSLFYQWVVFCVNLLTKKFMELILKYSMLPGDTNKVSILLFFFLFFLHKIKMNKQNRFTSEVIAFVCSESSFYYACMSKDYPGSSQNKSVNSFFK